MRVLHGYFSRFFYSLLIVIKPKFFFHFQIINLGETILPCMDIKALDNEWFYDDVTPRGVSFDALLPQASKTPLGNMQDFELIHTPANMAEFQSNYWYKKNSGLGKRKTKQAAFMPK